MPYQISYRQTPTSAPANLSHDAQTCRAAMKAAHALSIATPEGVAVLTDRAGRILAEYQSGHEVDTASSASRQHYIETGQYLPVELSTTGQRQARP